MSDKSGIPYCDATWNTLAGCQKVGKGCAHCYAERMTIRQNAMAAARGDDDMWSTYTNVLKFEYGSCEEGKAVGWNGHVETLHQRLEHPLHWRKPRTIFVNSMSDTFHDDVPYEFIAKILAVAAMCPQHTFLLFTKRWKRASDFYERLYLSEEGSEFLGDCIDELGGDVDAIDSAISPPISNIHLYFSASTQAEVDEAVPILLQIPVAVRGLSLEPLLEGVVFRGFNQLSRLHCIIGCESGPKRRPCEMEWIRNIVNQCRDNGGRAYVKQIPIDGKCVTLNENTGAIWPAWAVRELPK